MRRLGADGRDDQTLWTLAKEHGCRLPTVIKRSRSARASGTVSVEVDAISVRVGLGPSLSRAHLLGGEPSRFAYNGAVSTENIKAEVLKLSAAARARLVEKLLESLEDLTPEEDEQLWAEEAERRDAAWAHGAPGRQASDVFADARAGSK